MKWELPRGSEFFPLRAVPYGMKIAFITLGDLHWMLFFITHVRKCEMGASPMTGRTNQCK